MLDALPHLVPEGRVLLADDSGEDAFTGAREQGLEVVRWRRTDAVHPGGVEPGTPWPDPSEQPLDAALIRLPRARASFDFALAGCLSRLRPGAPVVVYGARDEGIASTPKRMKPWLEEVRTESTARRCRVLVGRVPGKGGGPASAELTEPTPPAPAADRGPARPPAELEAWREEGTVNLGWGEIPWVRYPGTFARGGVDAGTRLLVEHLPPFEAGQRVLDFAAGTGVVAAAVAHAEPGVALTLVEPDALARRAAARNVPSAAFAPVGSWDRGRPWDRILSNPPYHVGKEETLEIIEELIRRAAGALAAGGELRMVVQRRLPVEGMLLEGFEEVEPVADRGPHRVWRAARP